MSKQIINSGELAVAIRNAGLPFPVVPNGDYFCPTYAWLRNKFSPAFRAFLSEYNLRYKRDVFDCRQFAVAAVFFATLCLSRRRGVSCGHSIGIVGVDIFSGKTLNGIGGVRTAGHRTNLVVCSDNRVCFYEPQNGQLCDAKVWIDSESGYVNDAPWY